MVLSNLIIPSPAYCEIHWSISNSRPLRLLMSDNREIDIALTPNPKIIMTIVASFIINLYTFVENI